MALDVSEYMASLEPSAADREEARRMGMWNAAAMLLGGGPNRSRNIAQAMLGASQGYQTGLEQARRKRLADLQSVRMAQEMEERQRGIEQAASLRGVLNAAGASLDEEAKSVGPVQPYGGDVRERRRMLLERAAQMAQAKGDMESASRLLADADKLRDEWDPTPRKVMRDGKPVLIQTSKSGKERVMGYEPEPEKLHFADTGGRAAVGFDPFTGLPKTEGVRKTMTQAEIAAEARARAAQEQGKWTNDLERGVQVNMATGETRPITTGGVPVGVKPTVPTEDERRSAGLAVRMESALRKMKQFPDAMGPEPLPEFARTASFGTLEALPNVLTSTQRQQVESAQLDALDAALTLATGAAYTKEQINNLRKSYFPQLGDSEETKQAKSTKLAEIIETARIRAGRASGSINEVLGKTAPDDLSVRLPNGKVVKFKTRAEADGFRREAGL